MNKRPFIHTILTFMLFIIGCHTATADTFTQLWKDYEKAVDNDQPQTAITLLRKIEHRAEAEKRYGDLLYALLSERSMQEEISPDSLTACDRRNKAKLTQWSRSNGVLATLYNVSLGNKCSIDSLLASPDATAYTKANSAKSFSPLLEIKKDSHYFNHDLLSVIAIYTLQYEALRRYCTSIGNKTGACMATAMQRPKDIATLDSLIVLYQELPECCALAFQKATLYTDKQKSEQLAWIDEALRHWSTGSDADRLRNLRNEITNPKLDAVFSSDLYSTDEELTLYLNNIRNLNGVKVTARRNGDNAPRTFTRRFRQHNSVEEWNDSLSLGRLPLGKWAVTLYDIDGNKAITPIKETVRITDLKVMLQGMPDNKRRYIVVNRISGHPVAGAILHFKDHNTTYTTNAKGECITTDRTGNTIRATKGNDTDMPYSSIYSGYTFTTPAPLTEFANLYTDRSIYRPGQTVHTSVICHTLADGSISMPATGKTITVTLRNADRKEVESHKVTTDEYGTASADFTLPADGSNGRYTIRTAGYSTSIRVEEYKRPTYEVTLAKPTEAYHPGDTLLLHGKAQSYSGIPVAGAKVAYSISRNIPLWWRYWYDDTRHTAPQILCDTVFTQTDGTFTLRMPMIMNADDDGTASCRFYSIKAECHVTDIAGESHSASLSLPLGNHDTYFNCDLRHELLADSAMTIKFVRLNNAGTEISGDVTVSIDATPVAAAKSNVPYTLPATLASGKHTLRAICGTDTIVREFTVFRKSDTQPMTYTHDWWYLSSEEFTGGGSPWIQVGTSDSDVYAVYTLFSGNRVLESGAITINNSVYTRTFDYRKEYGDAITYTIAWVKNGRMYSHSAVIQRRLPSKRLTLKWTSFRDRLVPGQQEQWTLSVTRPDGSPAKAQLMSVLYDKSLDAILHHDWDTFDYRRLQAPYASWTATGNFRLYMPIYANYAPLDVSPLEFTAFKGVSPMFLPYKNFILCSAANAKFARPMLAMKQAVMKGDAFADGAHRESAVQESDATASDPPATSAQPRTLFSETAFFIPSLSTDAKGRATLRFTLPESVTTWRFLAIAHDKEMRMGKLSAEAVAQKQLMVQPRMPRFLRKGDRADVSTTVANLSDSQLHTTVTLTLLNAKTEEPVSSLVQQTDVKPQQTCAVTFPIDATSLPDSGVICRFMAEAGSFSDGEQHLLPILPDSEEVTVTHTYTLYNAGTTEYNTDGAGRLSVTYTDRPEQMMLQTLHDIRTPDCDNAISLVSALYANIVTATLKDSALYSGTANMLSRLSQLQLADGSFSWWKGMPGSTYMTMAVAKTLSRARMLAGGSSRASALWQSIDRMYSRAMNYMGDYMTADVERMKRDGKKGVKPWLSPLHLDWLYTLAISGTHGGSSASYLLKLVKDDTRKADMATKAVAAIVLCNNGYKSDAHSFAESIRQHTVFRSDMGRYFDSPRAEYSWCNYRIPTQTMCIEAMRTVTPDDRTTIAEMQRWLLNSKRTQQWNDPYAMVNAVHAFFGGVAPAVPLGVAPVMTLDGKPLHASAADSCTATTRSDTVDAPAPAVLSVTKQSQGESWLSLYRTFRQPLSDIGDSSCGISIKREVIVGVNPKVGDKVTVHITLTADRDYDFVSVRDNRAACLEPTDQLSGYQGGCYREMCDNFSAFHFCKLPKGTHVITAEYCIERSGSYASGSATAVCAYADEFCGTTGAYSLQVK